MKEGQTLWSKEELILAINLYCKTTFGRLHRNNPDVIELAKLIGRSANSVSYKLVNFASLDPSLKARGIKGAVNASKLDKEVWSEFYSDWEDRAFESEKLWAKFEHTTVEKLNHIPEKELPKEGKMREQLIKIRVNQNLFRQSIMASYDYTCCVTGINRPELLVAGHINKWSVDEKNRMNPSNGLALNTLHDKAFELGLITITPDYKIKVSSVLKKEKKNDGLNDYFLKHDNQSIILPSRFWPDIELLKNHNKDRFVK